MAWHRTRDRRDVQPGVLIALLLLLISAGVSAEEVHMSGMVVKVDEAHKSMTVSCQSLPGRMDAMTMRFKVRDRKLLNDVQPGTAIDFTVVEGSNSSYAENIRVRRYRNLEPEPLEAQRLAIVSGLADPASAGKALTLGQPVPDFALTDQARQTVTFSQFRGKVVALSFAYARCPNPAYCFRLTNNLSTLEKRFADRAGRELVLLTVMIDPGHDQTGAVENYAGIWHANPHAWHFLTGSLPEIQRVSRMFGMDFWNEEGFLTHSFHTVIIDRQGKLFANLEGNQFTSKQLGDLVETALKRP